MVDVIKASGLPEPFNEEKLCRSLMKTGADSALVDSICRGVSRRVRTGMSTDDIFGKAFLSLRRHDAQAAARYHLRRSLLSLGPEGFLFERFIARVLQEYGYSVLTGQRVAGFCVLHEVDVVAVKDKKEIMVECKYHNTHGIRTDLKVAMYTFARFLDIQKACEQNPSSSHAFHQPMLVTNTKCTQEAIRYAECQKMSVLSWGYPAQRGLETLIVEKRLYPVAALPSYRAAGRGGRFQDDTMFAKDIAALSPRELSSRWDVSPKRAGLLIGEAKSLLSP